MARGERERQANEKEDSKKGTMYCMYQASHGVRQGDPLSTLLFSLAIHDTCNESA